ncbi:hypothetical protein [Kitasatospora sp. NPDC004272]
MRVRTTAGRPAGAAATGALVVSLTAGTSGGAPIAAHRAAPAAAFDLPAR